MAVRAYGILPAATESRDVSCLSSDERCAGTVWTDSESSHRETVMLRDGPSANRYSDDGR